MSEDRPPITHLHLGSKAFLKFQGQMIFVFRIRGRVFVSFKYFEFLSGRDKSDRMSHELPC